MSLLTKNKFESSVDRGTSSATLVPRLHLQQEAEGYRLEVEMPGVSKEGVDVSVENGQLTIVGRREKNDARTLYSERLEGDFRRVLALDPQIDPTTIKAQMEQGLLTIRLQKAEALKARRVVVG